MIKIENLSLNFENKQLFENTDFVIPDGKFTFFTGANGTGKTTLFKIITGNLKIEGLKIINTFKKVFFLPQRIKYPENLTLSEYVTSYFFGNSLKWYISKEEKQKTEDILNLLELTDRQNIPLEKLSSGELQKANIAIALLSDADCLLLDEPTSNMDLINQIKVLDILKKLKNNKITCTVIIHDLNLASAYGDYFAGITKNHKIVQSEKDEFFTEENLKNLFGIDFKVVKNEKSYNIQINN